MSKKLNMNNSNCSKQTIIKMGQVLSIPDCVEELEQDQEEAVGRQDQDTDSEGVGRQDTTNEAVGRQDTTNEAVGRQDTTNEAVGRQDTTNEAVGRQDTNEAVGRQDQDTDSEAVGRQDTTNEAVGRQDTCQICHSIDIDKATSSCDSQYNDYILCSSCHYDLCSQNDTLIECEYCGNLWDGHAQCNCYYEEDDDM